MRKSRITQSKQARLIEHFVAGTTARTVASLVGVHRNSAALYFHRLRQIIALELAAENEAMFDGEIEVDESYFGGAIQVAKVLGFAMAAEQKLPLFSALHVGREVLFHLVRVRAVLYE